MRRTAALLVVVAAAAAAAAATPASASPLGDALDLRYPGWQPAAALVFAPEGEAVALAEVDASSSPSPTQGSSPPPAAQAQATPTATATPAASVTPVLAKGAATAEPPNEPGTGAEGAPSPAEMMATPLDDVASESPEVSPGVTPPKQASPSPAGPAVDDSMSKRTQKQDSPDEEDESDSPPPPTPQQPDTSTGATGSALANEKALRAPADALVHRATTPVRVAATSVVKARSPEEAKAYAIQAAKDAAVIARRIAAAANVSHVVETVDINRLRLECPRMPCPRSGRCPYTDGVCCANGAHCCPSGATCINTDPPTCSTDTLEGQPPCHEEPCSKGNMCPHKGVYLCCRGGNTCCEMGFQCGSDGKCAKIDSGAELQRQFEDMQQARAALQPRNAKERGTVMRTARQNTPLTDRLEPSTSPIIRIVTVRTTLPNGTFTPVAEQDAMAAGAASSSSSSSGDDDEDANPSEFAKRMATDKIEGGAKEGAGARGETDKKVASALSDEKRANLAEARRGEHDVKRKKQVEWQAKQDALRGGPTPNELARQMVKLKEQLAAAKKDKTAAGKKRAASLQARLDKARKLEADRDEAKLQHDIAQRAAAAAAAKLAEVTAKEKERAGE